MQAADAVATQQPLGLGQLLPLDATVGRPLVESLRALLDDAASRDRLADAVRDPRLPPDVWRAAFARELAHTLRWAVGRLLRRDVAPSASWDAGGSVVTLLPRHGLAAHVIRRALPFAACGVATRVTGHDEQASDVTAVVATLAEALAVGEAMRVDGPARAIAAQAGESDLVVVTGAPATATAVRDAASARVVGATGGCAVAIASTPATLDALATALRGHDRPGSCTRWGGGWVGDPAATSWRAESGTAVTPADVLAAAHPSVVYRVVETLGEREAPDVLAGYATIACDPTGVTGTLVGFGRDPRQGWPGDYLA